MNDFTKEELEDILSWSDVYCVGATDLSYRVSRPLIKKIQSMIDNYCEHKPEPISQEICCIKCQRTLI
ncbi:TPA: hypothetical protein ACPSKZ_000698 [Legionella anisa]|uniref:hypothetical protein n=1 Tax=Legionella anisa TaxID=28082 RepID=UPI002243FE51|nr:hypothetical protein [Legionella anisa]MCW8425604.1 hypothetical protein [Legionella anisa]MCW8448967.1 hypothetical protein [Legionella anisa]